MRENKSNSQQFSFSSGILDDPMQARQDLKQYFSGAKQLRNVICHPLGGVTLRGGLKTYAEIPEAATGAKLGKFEINTKLGFLCLYTDKNIRIYQNQEVKQNIESPYSGEHVRELDLNQSMDTTIITSEFYQMKKLVYTGNESAWDFADIELESPPQGTFPDTPGGKNSIQRLKFSSAAANNSFRLKLEGYKTASIIWSGDVNVNAARIKEVLGNLEILNKETGGVSVTPVNGEYDVEFIGTDGKKAWEDIIISIEEASDQCRVYTKCIQEGEPPKEPLWSVTRGWPFSSAHYQGRCIYGGCTAKSNFICGSMTTQPFTFRTTDEALDDEAITITADAEGNAHVSRVFGLEKLFVMTDKGVFVVPESPITPQNAYTVQHTDIPCAKIRPVAIDGDVVYVTQTNDGINQSVASVTYNYENEKYRTDDLALLAYSVMRKPVAMDVRRGTKRNNATYLFVVNADGSLAILNTKKSQELNGWTISDTLDGKFLDVCVVNDTPFFIVERQILGQTRYFIEYWDDDARFDLSVEFSSEKPKTLWSDEKLAFYEGLTVGIYADGLSYGEEKVENGCIILDFPASHLEVGLPFEWEIETMPVVSEQTSDGTLIGNRHRLPKVTLRVENSAGITLGKQKLSSRYFGRNNNLNHDNILMNGTYTARQLGYYGGNRDALGTIKLHGSSLQPLTLLSITAEVVQ